ncbi:MAG: hypothetical protein JKY89_11210 [Immundisolibacteraceae bacterium]|nr:hypothetical protein [Immundisolibacteraceae bacterium]
MPALYRNFATLLGGLLTKAAFKPIFRAQLCLIVLTLALFSNPPAATAADPDWCNNYQLTLGSNEETGRLVIHTSLVAHMRISMPVNLVRVTITGLDNDLPIVTSKPQCSGLVVIDQLPPGDYRLQSIEGNVDLFTAPKRFLYPLPGDGYRLILTGGTQGLYRVPLPRDLGTPVTIKAGETTLAGSLNISANPRRIWAIDINWNPESPPSLCAAYNRRYQQQLSCDEKPISSD